MTLSSRETALLIWMLVLVLWMLTKPTLREPIGRLVRTACQPKLLLPALFVALYVVGVVWALYAVGFWVPALLKDTLVWFVVSGLALAMSALSVRSAPSWRTVAKDQLAAVVLVEYVVAANPFSLVVEVVLVPILTFVALMAVMSERIPDSRRVKVLAESVLGLMGLAIIVSAFYAMAKSLSGLDGWLVAREVLLVPLLSFSLLPVAYVFFLMSAYEQVFLTLRIHHQQDPALASYAKRMLLRRLGIRPSVVRRFLSSRNRARLHLARTKADIDEILQGL